MSDASARSGWAARAHAVCDWLWFATALNAAWVLFTVAGGAIAGVAPASTAAALVTRARLRGESQPFLPTFAAAWRADFVRANVAFVPLIVAISLANANALIWPGPAGSAWACLVVALLTLAGIALPLYANYELPSWRYVPTAMQWLTRNFPHALLIAAMTVLIGALTRVVPGVLPFLTTGVWLTVSTTIGLALFHANEEQRGSDRSRSGAV